MSDNQMKFVLVQKARNTGGDKYECEEKKGFIVYIPQDISRENNEGQPKKTLTITIN